MKVLYITAHSLANSVVWGKPLKTNYFTSYTRISAHNPKRKSFEAQNKVKTVSEYKLDSTWIRVKRTCEFPSGAGKTIHADPEVQQQQELLNE